MHACETACMHTRARALTAKGERRRTLQTQQRLAGRACPRTRTRPGLSASPSRSPPCHTTAGEFVEPLEGAAYAQNAGVADGDHARCSRAGGGAVRRTGAQLCYHAPVVAGCGCSAALPARRCETSLRLLVRCALGGRFGDMRAAGAAGRGHARLRSHATL